MATDRRRTKIVATIGPATSTHEALRELVDTGVDAVRLNLSHGVHADHEARANLVREVQAETGKPQQRQDQHWEQAGQKDRQQRQQQ